jgi:Dienelactone hydrolase family
MGLTIEGGATCSVFANAFIFVCNLPLSEKLGTYYSAGLRFKRHYQSPDDILICETSPFDFLVSAHLPTISFEDVTFKCDDGTKMLVNLVIPAGGGSGKNLGIIVIHEAYGLNNQIRRVAKKYADNGFVGIAPNLFSRNSDLMK